MSRPHERVENLLFPIPKLRKKLYAAARNKSLTTFQKMEKELRDIEAGLKVEANMFGDLLPSDLYNYNQYPLDTSREISKKIVTAINEVTKTIKNATNICRQECRKAGMITQLFRFFWHASTNQSSTDSLGVLQRTWQRL